MFLICQAQEQLFNTLQGHHLRVSALGQGFKQLRPVTAKSQMQKWMHWTILPCHTQTPQLIALVPILILPTYLPITNLTSHIDLPTGREGTDQQTWVTGELDSSIPDCNLKLTFWLIFQVLWASSGTIYACRKMGRWIILRTSGGGGREGGREQKEKEGAVQAKFQMQ